MSEEDVTESNKPSAVHPQVEELPTDECWRLLQAAPLARMALVNDDDGPEIYPVNIQVDRGAILIRSGDDPKIRYLAARPRVALEADGATLRVRWSVIVQATAEIVDADSAAWPPGTADAPSWYPGEKSHQIRLTVDSITGRRFLVAAGVRMRKRAPSQKSH